LPFVSVYVDESGDLGFGDGASSFFTIGYAFSYNRHPFAENSIVKRTLKKINDGTKKKKRKIPEFKFSADSEKTKCRFLCKIQEMNLIMSAFCISKDSVKNELKSDQGRLYRYLVVDTIITHLVNDYFKPHDPYNSIRLIIDRSLSKQKRKDFDKYCDEKTSFRSWEQDKNMDYKVTVIHEDSKAVPMLQVADYIAGLVQRKFQMNDSTFYDLLSNKIRYKEQWDQFGKIIW